MIYYSMSINTFFYDKMKKCFKKSKFWNKKSITKNVNSIFLKLKNYILRQNKIL